MNKVFKLFTVLLMVGLAFGITACKKEEVIIPEVTEFNVLGGWTDGGDGVYTLNTNTTSELDFSYDKAAFPYAFMSSADITEDLSIFKKLVITVEGTGTMLIKLETSDTTPAKEVGLNVTGIEGTYEWNLIADSAFLAKVDKVVIIAAPGKEDSIGDIQVTQLKFDVAVADGFIIQTDFNNIPTNVNEYNGTDETFDFNMKWENFSEETYTISYVGSTTVVSFDKAAGQEWSTMQSQVQGDFTDFNYVVAVVTGTVGQKFLLKAATGYEAFVFLTAEEQDVVIDISGMTAAEKNAITAIFAFGYAGVVGTGDFVIHQAFMTADYEYEAPVIINNIYNGTDAEFAITQWYDGGDMNYTLTVDGTDLVVDYDKTADWANMLAHIEGDMTPFAKVEFEVTGTLNKTALFKVEGPNGNVEQPVTFDGTRQTIVVDLTGMTPTALATINKVVVFAAPGGSGAGQFTIHSTTFMSSDFSLQGTWVENDAGTYTFTDTVDDTVLVTYTKVAQGWVFMKSVFTTEEVAGLNTLTIELKGTDGKQVLVKANGVEQWVTFSGTDVATVTYTATAFTEIIMFAEGGVDNATGTFEIISAVLTYVAPDLDPTLVIDINSNWVENDAGTYAFTTDDGVVTVDYTKITEQGWSFFRQNFDALEVAGLNTLTMVVQGTAGQSILIKPNDSGALEQAITFADSNPVTVIVTADSFTNIIFFAEPNVAPASGSFDILSASLSYVYHTTEWFADKESVYTIVVTDGVTDVDYVKVDGQQWEWIKVEFDAAMTTGFNTLTITVQGTVGQTLLIKPNDNGALEQSVTFVDTDPVTLVITADSLMNIILFAEPNVAPATGSFSIIGTSVSYVESDFDPTVVIDANGDWFANVDTIYTVTNADGVTSVDYAKLAGNEWEWMKVEFDSDMAMGLNTLTMVVQGTVGQTILIKPNDSGALEQSITFADTDPVTVVVTADNILNVILFAEPNVAPATGSFDIVSTTLSYVYHTTEWFADKESVYTIVVVDGVADVDYVKVDGQQWEWIKVEFDAAMTTGFNTLTITVQGTVGQTLLIKPNDNGALEQSVTFVDTDPVTLVITADSLMNIILFAEPNVAPATGSFSIIGTSVSYVEPDFDPTVMIDANGDWFANVDTIYTITTDAGVTSVDYAKLAGNEWEWMKVEFDQDIAVGLNTLTMVVQGTVGDTILIKPNDNGALEQSITFTDTDPVTVVVTADNFLNVLIFAEPNVAPATGSFDILSTTLSYVNHTTAWFAGNVAIYTIVVTDGVADIDYAKLAGNEWEWVKVEFDLEMTIGLNTLTITVQGTVGQTLMIKPNDDGALEQSVTFIDTDPVTFVISADSFMSIIIFAEPNVAPATGSFSIISTELSYIQP